MLNNISILFIFCSMICIGYSQNNIEPDLPFEIPNEMILPLRQLVDDNLQSKLEASLKKNDAWVKLIKKKKMAVGLVDISDPYHVKFARVNGSEMMYAASLPKLAVLLSATQALEDGSLQETTQILNDMHEMISQSDNHAATRLIDLLGFTKIESTLTDPHYELYDPEYGGGLWVGKRRTKRKRVSKNHQTKDQTKHGMNRS